MKKAVISSILLLSFSLLSAKQVNIMDYSVDNKGKSVCTEKIQQAIDELSQDGGGVLYFPQGIYLTGTIIMKSNVHLYIDVGATLLGSKNIKDYKPIKPDYEALRTQVNTHQLLFAENQKNIGIMGKGTIDGQGGSFIPEKSTEREFIRPFIIMFINCDNIKMEDINLRSSAAWMQHYLACNNMQIRGLNIYNHVNRNNDGMNIDGCHNVTISDCIFDTDDDALVFKSTSPRTSENVTVTNCVISSHCNSIKMGTESTGGFKNIAISNCVVKPSIDTTAISGVPVGHAAVALEMVDGGILEKVTISNITVSNSQTPLFIRLGNRARKYKPDAPEPGRGILRNVVISNMIVYSESLLANSITGLPGNYAENITLSNIQFVMNTHGTKEMAGLKVPEAEAGYPRADMFGKELPASCLYIRHVKNLITSNITMTFLGDDERPAIIADDVIDSEIEIKSISGFKEGIEFSKIINSKNTEIILND
ncbi:glycoside hydrolase family 28 protein [Bacteroidota bacterium]